MQGLSGDRAILVIAHPGHELPIYGWLKQAKPLVCVLTDGSGHSGKSRLSSTTEILNQVGSRSSSIYGRYSDIDIYKALLDRNYDLFIGLTKELIEILSSSDFQYVVGDACEGWNPSHDICRLIINAAVAIANRECNCSIRNFDFLLSDLPSYSATSPNNDFTWVHLDNELLAEKVKTAKAYLELSSEIGIAIARFGIKAFQTECLRPVVCQESKYLPSFREPPWYEQYGENQVKAGLYKHVIRYREHILPLVEILQTLEYEVNLNGHANITD